MKKTLARVVVAAIALAHFGFLAVFGPGAQPASAATNTTSITYRGTGTSSVPVYDSGLMYMTGCPDDNDNPFHFDDPNDPNTPDPRTCGTAFGSLWFRVRAEVRTEVVTAQEANVTVNAPDATPQGDAADIVTTLSPTGGTAKEVVVTSTPTVSVDAAFDGFNLTWEDEWPFISFDAAPNCAANRIGTVDDLDVAQRDDCIDVAVHESFDATALKLIEQDTTLPFSGRKTLSEDKDTELLNVAKLLKIDWLTRAELKLRLNSILSLAATQGYHADRSMTASSDPGTPFGAGPLSFPSSGPLRDPVTVPCSVRVGDQLTYALAGNKWGGTATVDSALGIVFTAGSTDNPTDFTLYQTPSVRLFDNSLDASAANMKSPAGQVILDNRPPDIVSIAQSGTLMEGADTEFTAVAQDRCTTGADLDFRWEYSDGGASFGPTTHHTFPDDGTYTGRLTVTDKLGNAAAKNFSVVITNADPSATPPPDATASWGVPVHFHADVFDPSPVDQSTLKVQWNFGDGTGAAGTDVQHAYAAPGAYGIVLTVTDKDGGAGSANMRATIGRRATVVGMLGDRDATYATSATYGASVTDDLGNPVQGRTVNLETLGSPSTITAITDSEGKAMANQVVTASAGSYVTRASFAGDNLYAPSSASHTTTVKQKATTLTYTGPASSQPNKSVTLTAVLADVAGQPLPGRAVSLRLGSQVVSGVTDANGVVAAPLRLNQKPGSYPLTLTYAPAAGDAGRYQASTSASTFRIGNA